MDQLWKVAKVWGGTELSLVRRVEERQPPGWWAYCPQISQMVFSRRKRRKVRKRLVLLSGYVMMELPPEVNDAKLRVFYPRSHAHLLRDPEGEPVLVKQSELDVICMRAFDVFQEDSIVDFHVGCDYLVKQGPLIGVQLQLYRMMKVGDKTGEFLFGYNRITVPLYVFKDKQ